MPSSDDLFHNGKPIAPSMFKRIRATLGGEEPTPDEMARAFEEASHNKHVNLKDVCVKIFDMSKESQVTEYCELYRDLYAKVQRKEVLVRGVEKKFVEIPEPRWIIYIEWWEYALEVDGKEVTPEELRDIKEADGIQIETAEPELPAYEKLRQAGHTIGDYHDGEDS